MVSGAQGGFVQGSAVFELGRYAALEFVDALCYSAADDGGWGWGGEEGADLRMAWEVRFFHPISTTAMLSGRKVSRKI